MTEKTEEVVEAKKETNQVDVEITPVTLTLQDMQAISAVVNLAAKRGAFEAREMTTVGAAYNKLDAFLKYVGETQAKDKDDVDIKPEITKENEEEGEVKPQVSPKS